MVANLSAIDYYNFENLVMEVIESGKRSLFLVLDHLSDVRNFGAIVRTAECTGVSGIIIPKMGECECYGGCCKDIGWGGI